MCAMKWSDTAMTESGKHYIARGSFHMHVLPLFDVCAVTVLLCRRELGNTKNIL